LRRRRGTPRRFPTRTRYERPETSGADADQEIEGTSGHLDGIFSIGKAAGTIRAFLDK
jgi:hypothetical protein